MLPPAFRPPAPSDGGEPPCLRSLNLSCKTFFGKPQSILESFFGKPQFILQVRDPKGTGGWGLGAGVCPEPWHRREIWDEIPLEKALWERLPPPACLFSVGDAEARLPPAGFLKFYLMRRVGYDSPSAVKVNAIVSLRLCSFL